MSARAVKQILIFLIVSISFYGLFVQYANNENLKACFAQHEVSEYRVEGGVLQCKTNTREWSVIK